MSLTVAHGWPRPAGAVWHGSPWCRSLVARCFLARQPLQTGKYVRAMGARLPQTPDEAVQLALQGQWLGPQDHPRARGLIEARFSELFAPSPTGFRLLWHQEAREVLITWETDQRR